jgi:hypothetical protein
MEVGSERPPSMGNPNCCVPCVYGIEFPAEGSAAYVPTDGDANGGPVSRTPAIRESNADETIRNRKPDSLGMIEGANPSGHHQFPDGRWTAKEATSRGASCVTAHDSRAGSMPATPNT